MSPKAKKCKDCGTEFIQYNSLQNRCIKCLLKQVKEKRKIKRVKMLKDSGRTKTKLLNKADQLYQIKYKKKYPYSAISGEPTEAIHHFIYKSDSNNTRFDGDNAVPVTIAEHRQIHDNAKHTGALYNKITLWLGVERQQRLEEKRKIDCKLTDEYLSSVIDKLKKIK
jgi:hypothetical protein